MFPVSDNEAMFGEQTDGSTWCIRRVPYHKIFLLSYRVQERWKDSVFFYVKESIPMGRFFSGLRAAPEERHIVLHKNAKNRAPQRCSKEHVDTDVPAPQSPVSSLDGHQHHHQRQHQRQRQHQQKNMHIKALDTFD